jgi:hypothetical protein
VDEDDLMSWPQRYFGYSGTDNHFGHWSLFFQARSGAAKYLSVWSPGSVNGWSGPLPDGPADCWVLPQWTDYPRPPLCKACGPPYIGSDSDELRRTLQARGWPMLAMWGGFELVRPARDNRATARLAGATQALVLDDTDPHRTKIIPLAPIWPGFVLDALVYAAAWLTLFALAAAVAAGRRAWRRRRGSGTSCGYDVHGAAAGACPECGAAGHVTALPPR